MKRFTFLCTSIVSLALFASACGGGGGDGGTTDGEKTAMPSVVTKVYSAVSTTICAYGGIQVDAGIDDNGNGVLDPAEVDSTQYVCNGANGTDGLTALVSVAAEPAGANCTNGGKKVSVGLDADKDNVLDAAEISSTDYLCNGAAGQGGTNGLNSLTAIVSEPAGTNCANGGQKIMSGLDSNANGALDSGEITSTSYVCNGPAGPGVTWVEVTGTSQQAASNTGYMANNPVSQVTITLPPYPAVGDIVQVSGIGAGGWKVAQNAGQNVITKGMGGVYGALWTPRETNRNWRSIASSADGTKLAAVVNGGQIYTSTDSGVNWTARESNRSWYPVASNSDGTKLVAGVYGGQIYTSTDSGVNWTARETNRNWRSIASSADGTKLVAAAASGQIYTSTDSGVTWTARETNRAWIAVASSSDGTKLAAAVYVGQIYTSTDSGVTWTARETNRNWYSIASSADGTKLVAAAVSGQIYTSTDSGVTWTACETNRAWVAVASSSDGSKLVAAVYGSYIYTSTDSGVNWTARFANSWNAIASSSDGTKLAAVVDGGPIYTSIPSTTPGTAGSISGVQYDAISLQYAGNYTFTVLSHEGDLIVQ